MLDIYIIPVELESERGVHFREDEVINAESRRKKYELFPSPSEEYRRRAESLHRRLIPGRVMRGLDDIQSIIAYPKHLVQYLFMFPVILPSIRLSMS